MFSNSLFDSNERHFLLFYFRLNPRKNKIYRKPFPLADAYVFRLLQPIDRKYKGGKLGEPFLSEFFSRGNVKSQLIEDVGERRRGVVFLPLKKKKRDKGQ